VNESLSKGRDSTIQNILVPEFDLRESIFGGQNPESGVEDGIKNLRRGRSELKLSRERWK
jgi:hypothetical protein